MAENTDQQKRTRRAQAAAGMVPISDIIFMTLRHWPWILVSVAVCVGLAYLYLLRTPKVYTHTADLLVKDEDKKGKSVSQMDFSDLGLFQSSTNIQNEVTNLSAKDLMEEVVKRLGLDVQYYRDGTFHDEVAYGNNLPVRVSIAGYPAERSYSFRLQVDKNGKADISDLAVAYKTEKKEYPGTYACQLGDSVKTPVGNISVIPTPVYSKGDAVDLLVRKYPVSQTTKSFHKRLGVELGNEKGTVISLSFADPSEARADDVLATLISIYN